MTTQSTRNPLILLGIAAMIACLPTAANAFYQTTVVEGTIGDDIGGVWVAVHHTAPTFRVRIDTVEETKAPWMVGPLGDEMKPLMGEIPRGVAITKLADPSVNGKYGIFEGDIITKVNTILVDDVEGYNAALKEVKEWFLVSIRRPALQSTKARLVKIKYEASVVEQDGVSTIGHETIAIRVLPQELPFLDEIDEARRKRKAYIVSAEQIDSVRENWFELPTPDMSAFVSGEHRVVAADDYDQSLKRDEALRGTSFAIISQLKGNPLAGQVGQNIGIYGVHKVSTNKIVGTYVESTLASAPFPISIDFNGMFTLTRIDDYSDKDVEALERRKPAIEEQDDDVDTAPDLP